MKFAITLATLACTVVAINSQPHRAIDKEVLAVVAHGRSGADQLRAASEALAEANARFHQACDIEDKLRSDLDEARRLALISKNALREFEAQAQQGQAQAARRAVLEARAQVYAGRLEAAREILAKAGNEASEAARRVHATREALLQALDQLQQPSMCTSHLSFLNYSKPTSKLH